ncbi:MAG: efflux RND transporter periplasmic adaptor subunit [Oceanicaulis sp.]
MARTGIISFGKFGLGVAGLATALAIVIVLVSTLRSAEAGPGAPLDADPMPVRVHVATFEDAAEIESRFPALIEPRRSSALGFEAGGRIAEIAADTGDRVAAGAILARLDTRTLEAQLAAARAQTDAARSRAALAETTLSRQRRLVQQGHVSAQRLDEADAEARAARSQAAAAEADAAALQVRIALATIEAPYDGVVTARFADEGAIAAPGAPVLHLVEDGMLELRAGLPEAEARRLEPGRAYRVEIGDREVQAVFRTATGVIDPQGRSVTAVFEIEPGETARSGEVARLILPTTLQARGFWAPVDALAEGRRGLWSIYVLGEGDALEPRPVEILHSEQDRVYLAGAVEEGARFLSTGTHRVAPGMAVRAINEG